VKLKLIRKEFTDKSTIGSLFVDNKWECWTLEDVVREKKIKHETAIPAGTYQVIINLSNRFKRKMPLLLNVPEFEGIRIHSGYTAGHTSGCILVGSSRSANQLQQSKPAFNALFQKLLTVSNRGEKITIEIIEERPKELIKEPIKEPIKE
jgi:hypothetical protein